MVVSGLSDAAGRGIGEREDDRRPLDRPARAVGHRRDERLRQRVAHAAVLPVALQQRHGRGLARAGQQQVAPAATGGQQEDSHTAARRIVIGSASTIARRCRGVSGPPVARAGSGPRLGLG